MSMCPGRQRQQPQQHAMRRRRAPPCHGSVLLLATAAALAFWAPAAALSASTPTDGGPPLQESSASLRAGLRGSDAYRRRRLIARARALSRYGNMTREERRAFRRRNLEMMANYTRALNLTLPYGVNRTRSRRRRRKQQVFDVSTMSREAVMNMFNQMGTVTKSSAASMAMAIKPLAVPGRGPAAGPGTAAAAGSSGEVLASLGLARAAPATPVPPAATPRPPPRRMSEAELREHLSTAESKLAAARAAGESSAVQETQQLVSVLQNALDQVQEQKAMDWGGEEKVDEFISSYTVEPPPGVPAVALRKSANMDDRSEVPPLPRGLRVEGTPYNPEWIKLTSGLFLPSRFAKSIVETPEPPPVPPPPPPPPSPPPPAPPPPVKIGAVPFGNPRENQLCSRPYAAVQLTETPEGPEGARWDRVELPALAAAPGISKAALLWARRCAALCSYDMQRPSAPERRCEQFSVFASARCELAPPGCNIVPATGTTVTTYGRVDPVGMRGLGFDPHATPAPVDPRDRSAIEQQIVMLTQLKDDAKRNDDLVQAMELHNRIKELRRALLGRQAGKREKQHTQADVGDLVAQALAASKETLDRPADPGLLPQTPTPPRLSEGYAVAFGAGCFWRTRSLFSAADVPGVTGLAHGYMGGFVDDPTPALVEKGITGHAEVVRVAYRDESGPAGPVLRALLNVFWQGHNPFERGRQGPDIGSQFRSVIFYTHPAQGSAALVDLKRRQASREFNPRGRRIQTEVVAAGTFWPAPEKMRDHCKAPQKHISEVR
eukprot:TRINITY_DN13931_c0_g3_i1.p1 TRINITY_DN13931_c0_g3~~TRINITY_DN13931_c0_g3_i1.p1  ORF type:complete len:777 (+),score=128.04 TRINITY_DN13931_c0_g3_i1:93-2423(+)